VAHDKDWRGFRLHPGNYPHFSKGKELAWSKCGPADWALESFTVARDDAYGQLSKPNARGS